MPRAVPRERLFERLDVASRRRHVWVSGPPGAGKTTLVASWVAARRLGCLWYRVDAGDDDLGSFFFHLAHAAGPRSRRVRPGRLPLLTPEYLGAEAAFSRRFFRELAARRRREFVLVLDDLATLRPDAPLFVALRDGLEELTGFGSAVLVSREGPPAALARLVANDAMEIVDGTDLLLLPEEALAVGRAHAPRTAPPDELARACERAAGWTAGLVLLVRGAGRTPSAPTTPALFEYLAGEILDREDPEVRAVLMCAALPSDVPAKVAHRVCGSERAEAILGDLARKAYFTVRRGTQDAAFELHPLLREFLLARLRVERTPDELRALRIRAARALEDAGQVEGAIGLFAEADDWEEVTRLALATAPALLGTGRARSLEAWLRAIPLVLRAREPWLSYWLGACRAPFDPAEARAHFQEAYVAFARSDDVQGQYATCAAVIDTILIEWADFNAIGEWLDRLGALRARGVLPSSRDLDLRVTVSVFGAMTFHRNDDPALLEWEQRVLEIILDVSVPLPVRAVLGGWFVVESAMRGENARADAVVESLAPAARAASVDPPTKLAWLAGESVHHWHTGSPAEASCAVTSALDLAKESGVHVWDVILQLQGVNAALAEDDLGKARAFLAGAHTALTSRQPLEAAVFAHEEGLVALRAGDLDRAIRCANLAATAGEHGAMPFFRCLGAMMLALAATTRGDEEAARSSIAEACRVGGAIQSNLPIVLCALCEAQLAVRAGRSASACEHVRRAFALAREKRIAPDVWISRAQLAPLCALALDAGIEPDHVRDLVRRLRLQPPETACDVEGWPWRVRFRVLGPLEAIRDDGTRLAGRAHRRPLEVLAVLVTRGRAEVPDEEVANTLWPEAEGDRAHHALETALYRLRRLLGDHVVVHREGMLEINLRECWVDALAVEMLLTRASACLERLAPSDAIACAERAVEVYRGPLLAHRDDPWVLSARERLQHQIVRILAELARDRATEGRAADLMARAARADPALRRRRDGNPP